MVISYKLKNEYEAEVELKEFITEDLDTLAQKKQNFIYQKANTEASLMTINAQLALIDEMISKLKPKPEIAKPQITKIV